MTLSGALSVVACLVFAALGHRGVPTAALIGGAFLLGLACMGWNALYITLTAEVARRGAMLSTPKLAVNQHFAVVLDGKLLSVVYVNYHVYRLGIPAFEATDIGGGFSPATADQLAKEIGAPPLPADLQILRATTITRRVTPGSDRPAGATTARHPSAGPA